MKAAMYLGGTRGYQSAVYRPGVGWSGTDRHHRVGRQPRAFKADRRPQVHPLTVAYRRRPGLRARALIVSSVIVVATVLAVVLTGGARF
jgi:hypothetical protein